MLTEAQRKRVNEVASALEGTCKGLENEATEEEVENREFCEALDEQVLCCSLCGWWMGPEEFGDDSDECNDCQSHEVED